MGTDIVPNGKSVDGAATTVPLVSSTSPNPDLNQHFDAVSTAVVTLFALFVALLVASCYIMRRRRRVNKAKQSVYEHLSLFDLEDIDLKKSVTGGWHGTYQNNLF